jgi:hypothetical protein
MLGKAPARRDESKACAGECFKQRQSTDLLLTEAPEKLDPKNDEPSAPEHDVERFQRLLFPRRQFRELRHDHFKAALDVSNIGADLVGLA